MPEPYQPVDHSAVFRLVPLNSSSNLSVQSPGTPAGIGVTACGCSVGLGFGFRNGSVVRVGGATRIGGKAWTCGDADADAELLAACSPLGGAGRRQPPWHEEGCHADNYGANEGCLDHGFAPGRDRWLPGLGC